jgi:hypothetical protein
MKKLVRCTVCTWRGSLAEARLAPRVPRSDLPPPMLDHQESYHVAQLARVTPGDEPPPPCPSCGHHLTGVHKRRPGSIHP